jgi:putative inorganic carbon (HCO3(-)) transporter
MTRLIPYAFYLLVFTTPLIWFPQNHELFEFNKMLFVYLMTIIISFLWLWKMITTRTLLIRKTPLDIPLMLFLIANILSTIFSIDQHTSIWGYYSRSNGGLLSIISYITLYYALVSNLSKNQIFTMLKVGLAGGLVTALYAIPEHFGASPSCALLSKGQNWQADCWVQDVQARVFATLGQPNWLAAYLSMLFFPAFYLYIFANTRAKKVAYGLTVIAFYLAISFTYSISGTLGLFVGLALMLATIVGLRFWKKSQELKMLPTTFLLVLLLASTVFFGTGLIRLNIQQYFHKSPSVSPAPTSARKGLGRSLNIIRFLVLELRPLLTPTTNSAPSNTMLFQNGTFYITKLITNISITSPLPGLSDSLAI